VKTANSSSTSARAAVFLDRDDTLIANVPYLSDPSGVRLLPGASRALRALRRAGFALVLVTNQSAVGRGLITERRLEEIHDELGRLLAEQGASLDAIYYCPDVPVGDDRTVVENSNRKPGPGMLHRATADLDLDLEASWMVGDLISDVLAGLNAGCRSILVGSNATLSELPPGAIRDRVFTAPDFAAAAEWILGHRGVPPQPFKDLA
jgi:D-glycero-D-manno-heptose 1,7-bisphosphate phosphatase